MNLRKTKNKYAQPSEAEKKTYWYKFTQLVAENERTPEHLVSALATINEELENEIGRSDDISNLTPDVKASIKDFFKKSADWFTNEEFIAIGDKWDHLPLILQLGCKIEDAEQNQRAGECSEKVKKMANEVISVLEDVLKIGPVRMSTLGLDGRNQTVLESADDIDRAYLTCLCGEAQGSIVVRSDVMHIMFGFHIKKKTLEYVTPNIMEKSARKNRATGLDREPEEGLQYIDPVDAHIMACDWNAKSVH